MLELTFRLTLMLMPTRHSPIAEFLMPGRNFCNAFECDQADVLVDRNFGNTRDT